VILIVTNREDFTADWLIVELERRGTPFVRFNTEDYPARTRVSWTDNGLQHLKTERAALDLSEVASVWYRRPVPPAPSNWETRDRAIWAIGEAREVLAGLWRSLDTLWVNHPDKNRLASSKLHQLRIAPGLGFTVPSTLVSNDPSAVRAFMQSHPTGVVCKPVLQGRLEFADAPGIFFTSELQPGAEGSLDELGPEPYLFQEHVPKRYDVRVTVIDGEPFAARIESQQTEKGRVDWRRAGATGAPHSIEDLPTDVAQRCVDLVDDYGLRFGAIDLVRRSDGEYVFLELNPNGQWAWVEQLTGLRLRARLADLLDGGAK
jgi:glutathione synthase/RimK-type ligase-like ATP-grasp enzyme